MIAKRGTNRVPLFYFFVSKRGNQVVELKRGVGSRLDFLIAFRYDLPQGEFVFCKVVGHHILLLFSRCAKVAAPVFGRGKILYHITLCCQNAISFFTIFFILSHIVPPLQGNSKYSVPIMV